MIDIKPDHHVVLYSLPNSTDFRICHQVDYGLSEAHDHSSNAFVVRPFSKDLPIGFIRADIDKPYNQDTIVVHLKSGNGNFQMDKQEYENTVELARKEAENIQGKIVLSRIESEEIGELDLRQSLQNLRIQFPHAFIYLLHTPKFGLWIGATPELLVESNGEALQTMALAGTKWDDDLFTQKEFDEQFLVVKDIAEVLFDSVYEVGDVHEMQYGDIRHLRTMINWHPGLEESILEYAEKLHPTPAVSGYPRQAAKRSIDELEKHDRGLYAGYLGMLRADDSSALYVNLRCMQVFRNELHLYIGGGINEASVAEMEWEETQRKKETILSALVYD